MSSTAPEEKSCPMPLAIGLFLLLVGSLTLNVYIFGDAANTGANQISLMVMAFLILGIGRFYLKKNYTTMEDQVFRSLQTAIPPCFILLLIGPLISLWISGGVVPGLIYYGLELIHPQIFLPVTFISCSVISVSIGSSWSTMGTVGIALLGIGQVLGFNPGLVAGAIISGAYFGDKMSPLSDTTNLASAVSEVNLFKHINYMLYTTVPSATTALLLFGILSSTNSLEQGVTVQSIEKMQTLLRENFTITPLILLAPGLVLGLVFKRVSPLPAIFCGCLAGAAFTFIFQERVIENFSDEGAFSMLMTISHSGMSLNVGDSALNALLDKGGMKDMLPTIWFILVAMFLGGSLETTGVVKTLTQGIIKMTKGAGSLVGATISVCLTVNMTACDQYLAIVLPGKMFKESYKKQNLSGENLSRALEDGATLTSVLIPWNTGGIYASGVLGLSPLTYAPYCFFNLLCPLTSIFLASMNIKIKKADRRA